MVEEEEYVRVLRRGYIDRGSEIADLENRLRAAKTENLRQLIDTIQAKREVDNALWHVLDLVQACGHEGTIVAVARHILSRMDPTGGLVPFSLDDAARMTEDVMPTDTPFLRAKSWGSPLMEGVTPSDIPFGESEYGDEDEDEIGEGHILGMDHPVGSPSDPRRD